MLPLKKPLPLKNYFIDKMLHFLKKMALDEN
jgi:hypothetical protein